MPPAHPDAAPRAARKKLYPLVIAAAALLPPAAILTIVFSGPMAPSLNQRLSAKYGHQVERIHETAWRIDGTARIGVLVDGQRLIVGGEELTPGPQTLTGP